MNNVGFLPNFDLIEKPILLLVTAERGSSVVKKMSLLSTLFALSVSICASKRKSLTSSDTSNVAPFPVFMSSDSLFAASTKLLAGKLAIGSPFMSMSTIVESLSRPYVTMRSAVSCLMSSRTSIHSSGFISPFSSAMCSLPSPISFSAA